MRRAVEAGLIGKADSVFRTPIDDSVACWGANDVGQATPLEGAFAHISAHHDLSTALAVDGRRVAWGSMRSKP